MLEFFFEGRADAPELLHCYLVGDIYHLCHDPSADGPEHGAGREEERQPPRGLPVHSVTGNVQTRSVLAVAASPDALRECYRTCPLQNPNQGEVTTVAVAGSITIVSVSQMNDYYRLPFRY